MSLFMMTKEIADQLCQGIIVKSNETVKFYNQKAYELLPLVKKTVASAWLEANLVGDGGSFSDKDVHFSYEVQRQSEQDIIYILTEEGRNFRDMEEALTQILGEIQVLTSGAEIIYQNSEEQNSTVKDNMARVNRALSKIQEIQKNFMLLQAIENRTLKLEKNEINFTEFLKNIQEKTTTVLKYTDLEVTWTIPDNLRIIGDSYYLTSTILTLLGECLLAMETKKCKTLEILVKNGVSKVEVRYNLPCPLVEQDSSLSQLSSRFVVQEMEGTFCTVLDGKEKADSIYLSLPNWKPQIHMVASPLNSKNTMNSMVETLQDPYEFHGELLKALARVLPSSCYIEEDFEF